MCTDEQSLTLLKNGYQEFNLEKILPLSKLEHIEIIGSKAGFSKICKKLFIKTPDFQICSQLKDLRGLGASVTYPLLLKVDMSTAGRGVFICNSFEDLKLQFIILEHAQKKDAVLQKYIKGETIAGDALFRKGKLLECGLSKTLSYAGSEFGLSANRVYFNCPELLEIIVGIGEKIGIDGFCNITFIKELSSKKYYLIEADLRPHAWFRLSHFAGVNFNQVIGKYLSGDKYFSDSLRSSEVIMHFTRDIEKSIRRRDYKNILLWIFNSKKRWRFISKDPVTFFANIIFIFKSCLVRKK